MSGELTLRELPTAAAGPVGIAATHDDAVWFTEILAERIGRIPMDDAIQEIDLPGKPHAVVADPDDGVWVSLWGADQLARISGDGEIITIDLPQGSEPHGMAIGPRAHCGSRSNPASCCECPPDTADNNSVSSHLDNRGRHSCASHTREPGRSGGYTCLEDAEKGRSCCFATWRFCPPAC